MEIATVGIDLGKTVFHLVGRNPAGETVVCERFSQAQLLRFTGNPKVGRSGWRPAQGLISLAAHCASRGTRCD